MLGLFFFLLLIFCIIASTALTAYVSIQRDRKNGV